MINTHLLPYTVIAELTGPLQIPKTPCKNKYRGSHTWQDDYKVGDFCECSTWQVDAILSPYSILAIDVAGNKQEMYMD